MAPAAKSSPNDKNISIRVAMSGDVPDPVRLINAAFIVEQCVLEGDRINAEETQSFMETGKFLVAEDSTGFAGCVYVEARQGRGYLGLLAVHPARQGAGLGRKLLAAAEDYFRTSGCSALALPGISPRPPH